ncbi:MAG TPA: poly-gamma-glutamate biosynthesis protein PgsC/CapC, partial [Anaeromyxobacteraceae bacterium]
MRHASPASAPRRDRIRPRGGGPDRVAVPTWVPVAEARVAGSISRRDRQAGGLRHPRLRTVLALFPPGLESTLLVPVLLGALVMAVLTEWWGWDFVGVVVPGYLSSVLLLEPLVAAVVLLEAVATVAAVRGGVALLVRARL